MAFCADCGRQMNEYTFCSHCWHVDKERSRLPAIRSRQARRMGTWWLIIPCGLALIAAILLSRFG